mmetsp:Transcript_7860/g.16457  ORF Transcript_7860/g.16457 Transcript_7860/m.16457 type:complete len:223 (-) Transcript_7860:282-950(-)
MVLRERCRSFGTGTPTSLIPWPRADTIAVGLEREPCHRGHNRRLEGSNIPCLNNSSVIHGLIFHLVHRLSGIETLLIFVTIIAHLGLPRGEPIVKEGLAPGDGVDCSDATGAASISVATQGEPAGKDGDGAILLEFDTVPPYPDSAHLVRHKAPMACGVVDPSPSALEVVVHHVLAADAPLFRFAGIQPTVTAPLLPKRLAMDPLPGQKLVLAGTPLLAARR